MEGREGGSTPDFKWQGWSKDFMGFKIVDFGVFLGRKVLASIFLVAWFIAKFVVSRCALQTSNGFFCSVNHLSWGGTNANHNATHWPSLDCKKNLRMTVDGSRIAKEMPMMSGLFVTLLSRARDKNKNYQNNLPRKVADYCPKQGDHKQRTLKHRNKNAPITSKYVFPKRSSPLRWLTEQTNPKFLWSLHKAQRDTTNLAIRRDFWGYLKLIFLFFMLYHFMLPGNCFYGSEIRHGIFWGINFGPAIFLGFDLWPRLIIPVTWNSEYLLWAWVKLKRTLYFSHFPSQVNLYFSYWKLCGGEQWKNQTFLKP